MVPFEPEQQPVVDSPASSRRPRRRLGCRPGGLISSSRCSRRCCWPAGTPPGGSTIPAHADVGDQAHEAFPANWRCVDRRDAGLCSVGVRDSPPRRATDGAALRRVPWCHSVGHHPASPAMSRTSSSRRDIDSQSDSQADGGGSSGADDRGPRLAPEARAHKHGRQRTIKIELGNRCSIP